MKTKLMGLLIAAAIVFGAGVASAEMAGAEGQLDTQPGPAFQMIQGKLKSVEGNVWVVEQSVENYRGESVSSDVRLYVGNETKRLKGNKKVGDKIRAEVTRGGFANTIQ